MAVGFFLEKAALEAIRQFKEAEIHSVSASFRAEGQQGPGSVLLWTSERADSCSAPHPSLKGSTPAVAALTCSSAVVFHLMWVFFFFF